MSHWRMHKSNVLEDVKMDLLEKACIDLGTAMKKKIRMDSSIKEIDNSWGHESVDAGLVVNDKAIALGFTFEQKDGKNSLSLTGDFYSTGLNEADFIDLLAQQYMKHKTVEQLEENSWTVDSIETNANGEIEVMAHPWGEF